MRKFLSILAVAFAMALPSFAQTTTLSASHIAQDTVGTLLSSGQLCLAPVNSIGQPSGFEDNGTQYGPQMVCLPIAAGAITSTSVPDVGYTNPSVLYRVSVEDSTGKTLYTLSQSVAITGTTFDLDNWTPTATTVVSNETVSYSVSAPQGRCGTSARIWYDATDEWHCVNQIWDHVTSSGDGGAAFVGGTLSTPLYLSELPVAPYEAAPKLYVDQAISGISLPPFLGGTLTQPLILAGDPTDPLGASSKEYVDAQAATAWLAGGTMLGVLNLNDGSPAVSQQYVANALSTVDSSAFVGGTLTQALILAADPTVALGAATKQYTDAAATQWLAGGTLTGPLTLSDGSLAASEAYVASAVSGLSGATGTTTTNQVLATKVTSASAPGKICATVAGIDGSVACGGVSGTPTAITVQSGLNTPILNTVGVANSVAQYGITVNSGANTQILLPTTIGSYDTASVFRREMWFEGGSNLPGLDNFETDHYNFIKASALTAMFGWQCNRHNTGYWQYDNFSHGWTNTAVPCSIVAGHIYHFILWTHIDLAASTETFDTFQLDDVTAATSNTYTINESLPMETETSGNGRVGWDGVGSQVQIDVVDSSASSGSPQLVSMYVDDDNMTAYIPVTSSGGSSSSVTETTGNLGEYDFDGSNPTSGLTATGTPTLDSTNSYSSPNAALFNAIGEYYTAPISPSASTFYARFMVNLGTLGTGNLRLLELDNGSTQLANIYLDASSHYVTVSDSPSSTQTVCQTTAFSTGAWHRVELAWTEGSTTGSYQVLIDGVQTCSVTGTNTGTSPVTQVKFGEGGSVTGAYTFDLDNVGFSSTALLGAVTINTVSSAPLYDLAGAAAAAQAYATNASHLSSGTIPASVFPAIIPGSVGTAIASATTIAPVAEITHITGTTVITTITPPYTGYTGCIVLIADGAWSLGTGGNVSAALSASSGSSYRACFDGTSWYVK